MGGITTVLAALPAVLSSVQAVSDRNNDKKERQLAERQLAQTQALQMQQAVNDAALQKEQMALSTKQSEEERKAALKRAVARQRANFGAQGVGSSAGSSQAVLLGLFEESEAERARREELDKLRVRIVDEDVSQRSALNILQRRQLQERNRVASYGRDVGFLNKNLFS